MSIQDIVQQSLSDGYLTPTMEAEVGRICEGAAELSLEEYMALDRLMGCLLSGEVVAMPHKQFINVMEELVVTEVISQVAHWNNAKLKNSNPDEPELDIADIAAYALNRLPPLYATSEEGANYQRERASQDLLPLIQDQVKEGLHRFLDRPNLPDRNPLSLENPNRKDILAQMSVLLESFAPQ
ncbi:MAG: late competence development ComFB family protein [Microcystaceae cyanobacterium]